MANVCTNRLYLETKDKERGNNLIEAMCELFYCSDVEPIENDEALWCEMEFDSKWKFPKEKMEELTKELPEENDFYIRVLSHEFANEYIGFHIYTNGEWCDKLADKY